MPNLLSKLPLDPASVTTPSPPTADTVIELPAGSHGVDGLTKNPGTTLIRPQPGVSRDEITLHFAGSWNNKNLVIEGCTLSAGQGEWCFGGNTSTELWLIDCEFIGADFPGTGDITNAVLHQGTALYFINSTIRRIRRPCWMSGTTIGGKSFAYNSEFYDCYEDFAQHLKTAKNIYAERIGINVPSGGHPDVFQRGETDGLIEDAWFVDANGQGVAIAHTGGVNNQTFRRVFIRRPASPWVISDITLTNTLSNITFEAVHIRDGAGSAFNNAGSTPTNILFLRSSSDRGSFPNGGAFTNTDEGYDPSDFSAWRWDPITGNAQGGGGVPPSISNTAPDGAASVAYSHQYTASGDTPLTWSLVAGSLPPGLSLTSGGLLSGTPTQDGSYNFTIGASNSTGTDTLAETVEIAAESTASILDSLSPQPSVAYRCESVSPEIGSGDLVLETWASFDPAEDAYTGDPNGSISVTGDFLGRFAVPNVREAVETPGWGFCMWFKVPALPAWEQFAHMENGDSRFNMGVNGDKHFYVWLSTPTAGSFLNFGVVPALNQWHRVFVWHDGATLRAKFNGTLLSEAYAGADADLPAMMTIGAIPTGSNSVEGFFDEIYIWNDNPGDIDSQLAGLVTATPAAPDTPPTITNTAPDGEVGDAYSHQYTADGDTPITWSIISGTLPAGLSMDSAGLISGTPTADGSYQFTVQASNTHGNETLIETVDIVVDPAAVPSITNAAPDGAVGVAYSHQYTASGDTPITWSILNGVLPPGLTLDSDGLLSGTPTAGGDPYTFTVRATNLSGEDDLTEDVVIAVAPSFDTHPSNRSATPGGTAQFDVSVSGVPVPTLQWQVDDGGGWADITDETGASLILVDVSLSQDGHQYRCVATNSEGSATSNAATLTVKATNRRGIRDLSRSIFNFPRMYGPIALYRR